MKDTIVVSTSKHKLDSYRKKRDFSQTSEPSGSRVSIGVPDRARFVIQKHKASRLHYDFRLEVDGVLKSWAVPKGPSTNPSEKRLAVETEDHPMEYADFEGTIPEDEYGGGTVMVWDAGTYENIKKVDGETVPMEKTYENGQIEVSLEGKKLRGGYALVKMKGRGEGNWLLIKMKDEEADARRNPTSTENKSVKTGRTMDEIEADSAAAG